MLCLLDDFAFESQGVNLSQVKRKNTYTYAQLKIINGFDHWQATGQYEQKLTLTGKLIQQANSTLDDLHYLAEQKKAVTLAFDDGRASSVIILEINTDASLFLKNGQFLKQHFTVTLAVVHGDI